MSTRQQATSSLFTSIHQFDIKTSPVIVFRSSFSSGGSTQLDKTILIAIATFVVRSGEEKTFWWVLTAAVVVE